MIPALKPYPDYKDFGLPWLGQIPEHWTVLRAKCLFREVDHRSVTGEETHLSMSQQHGLVQSARIESWRRQSESHVGGKLCQTGDLVLNRLKAHLGVFAHASVGGVVSPDYTVLRLRQSDDNVRYFEAVFRTPACITEIRKVTKGIVEGFWRLYTDDFYNLRVPFPPPAEQSLIARFLDHLDRRVRRYIRAKRRIIDLLNEQKQAIIHRAVTRGLDPNVRLKSSGVEWLGDVPEHWDVLRTRYLFREIDRRSEAGKETHLSMSQQLGLVPSSMVEQRTLVSESYAGGKLCEPDDLVLNRLKAHLGVFALAAQGGVISPDYTVFRKIRQLSMPYFERVLRSPACRFELRVRAKGIVEGFWRLYTDDFYDIRLPFPPPSEQGRIVAALEEKCAFLGRGIEQARREIELIGDYRARLGSDVVTGKLDVREAAACLPDDGNETEPIAETDAIVAEDDEVDADAMPEEIDA